MYMFKENTNNKIFLVIISFVVVIIGFYNGVISLSGSQDLQYYPSKLFREGIDFYSHSLSSSDWFMSQRPNYFHQLYFILSPFTILDWSEFKLFWFLVNITLIATFFLSLKIKFGYKLKDFIFLLFPFLIGFPLTNTIGNGQFGIVVIFLSYFSWIYRENKVVLPILLSFLMMKYSFGIPIIIGFFIMGYYRQVILSGIISLIFPLVYSIIFKISFFQSLFLPYKVSSVSTGIGSSDLMSLSRLIYGDIHFSVFLIILFFLGILFLFGIKKIISKESILVCSILISFFSFFHMSYDWVVLILLYIFIMDKKIKTSFYVFSIVIFTIPRVYKLFSILGYIDYEELSNLTNHPFYITFIMGCFIITFFWIIYSDYINLKSKKI